MTYDLARLWSGVEVLRREAPLVHNITNYVVMHTVANSLLAAGASPIMAHALEEIEEITGISSALSLNIGTLSPLWVESMLKAIDVATQKNIPVVLDPVGAGASSLRTNVSLQLLERIVKPIIRGNASEIMSLAGERGATRGVDSTASSDSATEAAKELALRYQGIVCVSGEEDFITNGVDFIRITGGSPLMPKVTGMGCTASALVAAAVGAHHAVDMGAVASAMGLMSAAGGMAAAKCQGSGTFLPHFIDALGAVNEQNFIDHIQVHGRQHAE